MQKKISVLLITLFFYCNGFSQSPNFIPYQAVIRNVSGQLIANQNVGLRFSIHDSISNGPLVYQEIQNTLTSPNGLVNIAVGQGSSITGSFLSINWGNKSKFLQIEIDISGGGSYTDMGTQQLMSVPYALYANNGLPSSSQKGDLLYHNGNEWVKLPAGGYGQSLVMCDSVPSWGGCVPKVTTANVSSISYTTATVAGSVIVDGGFPVTVKGVCWSTNPNPTVNASTKTIEESGVGGFTSNVTGLLPNTTYYFRAYATNSIGTGYGSNVAVSTTALMLPVVSSYEANNIMYTTATAGGNVSVDGGATVTARGICWSTNPNPTVSLETKTIDGTGTGGFNSNIAELIPNTTYFYRAYATNSVGTSYGEELIFNTLALTTPTLSTYEARSISDNNALCEAIISDDGGSIITERGFCWSTNTNPTVSLPTRILAGTGSGNFSSMVSGLSLNTTYYVRAYALNSMGLSYGNEISFTTWSGEPQTTGKVVISQIYGGGGSTPSGGAQPTYKADYVELHNKANTAQDISGFKLLYGSRAGVLGSFSGNRFSFPAGTIIPAGGYLLVANNPADTMVGAQLPVAADHFFSFAMSKSNGKVALGTSAMLDSVDLAGQPATALIDFVGYGTALDFEAAAAAGLDSITAAYRNNNGCDDTGNNQADFTNGAPLPRNSTSPVNICGATTNPTISAGNLAAFGNVCVNTTASGSFTISGSNLTTGDITLGPLSGYSFSFSSAGPFSATAILAHTGTFVSTTIYVNLTPTAAQSYDGNIPVSGGGANAINVAAVGTGVNNTMVTTGSATGVGTSGATMGGTLAQVCAAVSSYGFEYSTTSGFTPGTGIVVVSTNLSGTSFSSEVTALTPNTTYYFLAFAITFSGTIYGAESSFTTLQQPGSTAEVVISQIYGGGGAPSASTSFNSDFVELHNTSSAPQDITGFKLAYGSSSGFLGATQSNRFTFPANTIIPAGGYLLVADSGLTGGTNPSLPVARDFYFRFAMSATRGKIVLGTSALIDSVSLGGQPEGAVIDFVGYGTATEYEGPIAVGGLSFNTAALRNNNGCDDTNQNGSDFTIGAPNPRNSTSPAFICPAGNNQNIQENRSASQ